MYHDSVAFTLSHIISFSSSIGNVDSPKVVLPSEKRGNIDSKIKQRTAIEVINLFWLIFLISLKGGELYIKYLFSNI